MTALTKTSPLPLTAPGAEIIITTYRAAKSAMEHATDLALKVGLLLIEQRDALSGNQRAWQGATKDGDDKFSSWLARNCAEISPRTAYRWMEAATRSGLAVRALAAGTIDVDAISMPMSRLLTCPEDDLDDASRSYRQAWFDFTSEKTLNDCLNAVIDGEKDPSAITRAHNGKHAAGAGGGGDRKNFVGFVAVKLRHITTFVTAKLSPGERAKISASVDASIERWPNWLLETMQESIKAELKKSPVMRAANQTEK